MNQVAAADISDSAHQAPLRYGEIPLENPRELKLIHGLPGFEHLEQFFLAELKSFEPFCALVARDEPDISLLMIQLEYLHIAGSIRIPEREWAALGAGEKDQEVWTILKTDQETGAFSANVRAPVIVNRASGMARQIILDNDELDFEYLLSEGLI